MNKAASFVFGATLGMMALQLGHYLYLRNGDYMNAFALTGVGGFLATLFIGYLSDEGVFH